MRVQLVRFGTQICCFARIPMQANERWPRIGIIHQIKPKHAGIADERLYLFEELRCHAFAHANSHECLGPIRQRFETLGLIKIRNIEARTRGGKRAFTIKFPFGA
jgi:hypothetical protein